jgi:hypothetical protein
MNSISKLTSIILILLIISACNDKKPEPLVEKNNSDSIAIQKSINKESIEGVYETQSDPNYTEKCAISVEIIKAKDGYEYTFKTKLRNLKGKATFTSNESGEKYLVLEGIKWDEYEGDISNEEESDSIADSKPKAALEIPVGIDASYVKDTLTIQNYGNSMNSYTKISECGRKYIQLIKK